MLTSAQYGVQQRAALTHGAVNQAAAVQRMPMLAGAAPRILRWSPMW